MAQEHNVLSRAGRLLTALGIGTGLADGEEGVVRLSETLQPVIDMWNRPDLAFTRGERLATAAATMAAGGAATTSFIGIKNASSNILLLVRSVFATATSGDFFGKLLINTAAPIIAAADLGPAAVRDTRLALGSGLAVTRSTVIRSNPAAPGSGGTIVSYLTIRVPSYTPLVIAPGYSFLIETTVENIPMTCAIEYEERLVLPGELLRP